MDLPWSSLRALRELSRRGTMAAAAAALGYTPGAVSQQIAALEALTGVPVVTRVGRGVQLTGAGRVLAASAEQLLDAQARALGAVESLRAGGEVVSGTVRLGTFSSSAATLLAPIVAAARAQHPQLVVASREVDVDALAGAVRLGDVDLAFGLDYSNAPIPRPPGLAMDVLLSERLGVATGSPDRPAGPVGLAAFADADWILPSAASSYGVCARSACRAAGFEPRVVHEVTDTAASLALVARGLGVTFVTDLMLALPRARGLGVVALHEQVLRHIVLIRRAEAEEGATPERPAVAAVAALVAQVVAAPGSVGEQE